MEAVNLQTRLLHGSSMVVVVGGGGGGGGGGGSAMVHGCLAQWAVGVFYLKRLQWDLFTDRSLHFRAGVT